ncbi:MAG TPA: isochorismatase family protein [Acidimicrobiales bacterium]|nr:isochorismatase family protein [Acidimicrobiales bacterium]
MSRYDPSTALVVVDVQNDFADPAGSLYVPGGDLVVEAVNDEIDRARAAGALVVYTQDWHPADTPHFAAAGGTWPPHCVRETWGAELHPRLNVPENPAIVRKGTGHEDGYSGFTVHDLERDTHEPTGLDRLLRSESTESVVVVGLARDVCVLATALDALRLGYRTSVVLDATASVDLEPGDDARAVATLRDAGVELV